MYKEGIYKLSMNCAQQAAKLQVDRYVEISSGNLNASEKVCNFNTSYFIKKFMTKVKLTSCTIPIESSQRGRYW